MDLLQHAAVVSEQTGGGTNINYTMNATERMLYESTSTTTTVTPVTSTETMHFDGASPTYTTLTPVRTDEVSTLPLGCVLCAFAAYPVSHARASR
jgi:hypothetical protein